MIHHPTHSVEHDTDSGNRSPLSRPLSSKPVPGTMPATFGQLRVKSSHLELSRLRSYNTTPVQTIKGGEEYLSSPLASTFSCRQVLAPATALSTVGPATFSCRQVLAPAIALSTVGPATFSCGQVLAPATALSTVGPATFSCHQVLAPATALSTVGPATFSCHQVLAPAPALSTVGLQKLAPAGPVKISKPFSSLSF